MEIKFFRKRSGKIVNFNPSKIEGAIRRALSEAEVSQGVSMDETVPSLLANVVVNLLDDPRSEWYVKPDALGSRIPRLEHVQDVVVQVLGRTWPGLPESYTPEFARTLSRLYSDYRKRREDARNRLKVVRKGVSKVDVTDREMLIPTKDGGVMSGWDRDAIERELEKILPEPDKAAEIAKRVERAVLKSGLETVSYDLVVELVNNELTAEGFHARMNSGRGYFVDKDYIDGLMESKSKENSNIANNNPEAINLAIAEFVLKKWALDNVFSPDIVRGHQYGLIYLHDLGYITRVYCSSHSIEYLKRYGLKDLNNLNTESGPAKSASVLTGHLNTYLASMQAYYAGALGLGYINVFYAPMLVGMSDKEMYQTAQEMVFNGSQNAFSRGGQTLFLDYNIHTGVPEHLRNVPAVGPGGKYYVKVDLTGEDWRKGKCEPLAEHIDKDGNWCLLWNTPDDEQGQCVIMRETNGEQVFYEQPWAHVLRYGDYQEETRRFANALLDVWKDGDVHGHIFEFPKCDFHVNEDTFRIPEEHEVFMHACEVAAHNGSVYFVFDRDSVSVASCCFTGDTPVVVKGGKGSHVRLLTFKALEEAPFKDARENLCVLHNGGWSRAKLVTLPGKGKPIVRIVTVNHVEQKVTCDHIVPTLDGDKRADEVTENDYILFNTRPLPGARPNQLVQRKCLSYEQGVLIGAYLGDGSIEQKGDWKPIVHFSLNEEKYRDLLPSLRKALSDWGISDDIVLGEPYNNVYPVRVNSRELKEVIREWVCGGYSYEKDINLDCLKESVDFRKGIIDGLYATDGGNSNRIYTTSCLMVGKLEVLLTSLGLQSIIDKSDRTGEGKVEIRGKAYDRNYPVYCVRWYESGTRRQYSDVYRTRNNSVYFKVSSIETLPEEETVYCFQVEDDNEPYFTLPSGVITHNCRLRVSIDVNLFKHPERIRSVGFQNVTINLPQCAYRSSVERCAGDPEVDSDTWRAFISEVDNAMDLAYRAHLEKKVHIECLMSGPGMPLWQVGKPSNDGTPYIQLDKAVYIIGLIGLDDACRFLFGKSMWEDPKLLDWGLTVVAHMNLRAKRYSEESGLTFNLEESPAESAARKLARSDLEHFPEQARGIVNGPDDAEYYTNSVHAPADAPLSLVDRIVMQGMFHGMIDSGAITHAFIGEETPSAGAIADLVEQTFRRTQSAQVTFSPEFTYCKDCNAQSRGLLKRCPQCGSENVVGETRVVGYFSQVENWNKSKRYGELVARQRGRYSVEEAK